MPELVIVGAGGHGRELLDVVEAVNRRQRTWDFIGFVDDGPGAPDRLARRGATIIARPGELTDPHIHYVIGIGDSGARWRIDSELTERGLQSATLVHPLASIASDNRLAPGVVLAAGARVTTNVELGRHVHLNVNAVVSHDCRVGDHTTLSPGVLVNGGVTIGAQVFLGTGAIVTPGVRIGDRAVVGAGAVVLTDVPAGVTVVGVPAGPR